MTTMAKAKRTACREALAHAIDELAAAERAANDAIAAHAAAHERLWAARNRLDAIREANAAAPQEAGDAFLAAHRAGREASVAELTREDEERATVEAAAAHEIAALTKAREALEASLAHRRAAVERTRRRVDDAVRCVVATESDAPLLLRAAERAAAEIVARRSALLALAALLPAGESRQSIDEFLARPWLMGEVDGSCTDHDAAMAWRDFGAALAHDADTPPPPELLRKPTFALP